MLPRYLFADVDDTFTVAGSLHPGVLEAVEKAHNAGVRVILNTGRPAGFGAALFAYLPRLDAVVVENGGAWFDRQGLHQAEPHLCFAQKPPRKLRSSLASLTQRVAHRLQQPLCTTADNRFRLTDYTVLRPFPSDVSGRAALDRLAQVAHEESGGQGHVLSSSIHVHFSLDGSDQRSKAAGAEKLLASRGVCYPAAELAEHAVAVGDSGNDRSFFVRGRFALSVGVRNIERHLPELGPDVPQHITTRAEGLGLCELIDDLLQGRLGV